jgi:threonine dehydrogenase-like Zn-dependent dehydrogenase
VRADLFGGLRKLMRAVVFDLSIPRYLAARALGKRMPSLYYGRGSCLSLREVAEPALPGAAWARVAVDAAGVCGSDIATILLKMSPALSPFSSFPSVMGHEIFGRLAEVGADARARGWREGDRVAVNPAVGCEVRGILPHCPACAVGHAATCHHAGSTEKLAPGNCIGYHRDLPGGFCESMVAHGSQLVRVPDSVPDARAVMVEPLAIGLHAVLRHEPKPDDQVLIIGGGMIAYAVLAALRLSGHRARVTQVVLLDYQAEAARALGADEVIAPRGYNDLLDRVAALTGARRHKPVLGPDVLTGGFALTYDCIGSPESLRDALAVTRSQGTVVLVGAAGVIPKIDLTAIWSREISVVGTCFYAPEPAREKRHTMELVCDLIAGDAGRPVDALLTHHFALEKYQEAVIANLERGRFKSIKTVLHPRGRA